jgi:CrcB protein
MASTGCPGNSRGFFVVFRFPAAEAWEVTMQAVLLIGLGGMLGANARYLVSVWAAGRFGTAFPYGTLIINVSGSALLGFILTLAMARFSNDPTPRLLLATGFLGAYTTFSTFAFETVALVRQGSLRSALGNAVGSTAVSVLGACAGILLATLLAGPQP